MRERTFRDAIREALAEEMERQPRMIIIGEDITPGGGTFGIHTGLAESAICELDPESGQSANGPDLADTSPRLKSCRFQPIYNTNALLPGTTVNH